MTTITRVRLEMYDEEEERWQVCGEFACESAAEEEQADLIKAGLGSAQFRVIDISVEDE